MNKIKLGILAGGNSAEREVSLKSCNNLINSIDEDKYDVHIYSLPDNNNKDWIKEVMEEKPDVVVSALHGGIGENGSIQGLLHCLSIPYVGSGVLSSALCLDKKSTKTVLEANHIKTAGDVFIRKGESLAVYEDDIRQLGFPLIVKPNRGGSSIGIAAVESYADLEPAVINIMEEYGDDVLVEKFVKGKEITCCIFEKDGAPEVLSVLEVSKKGEIFGYEDKYERGVSSALANMPKFMQDMVRLIGIRSFDLLQCKDYACVDMIVMEEQIYVIEVNTLPGLTKSSLIPKACLSYGISFSEFIDMLIKNTLKEEK